MSRGPLIGRGFIPETLLGMVDAASDAKRWGCLMGWGIAAGASFEVRPIRDVQPVGLAFMSVEIALEIWKWRLSWTLCISGGSVGNDFQQPLGNEGFRDFQMSSTSTPYGGPAYAERRRPAQAVGAEATAGAQCRPLCLRVWSHHGRARQTAITFCRHGRFFGPDLSASFRIDRSVSWTTIGKRRKCLFEVSGPASATGGLPRHCSVEAGLKHRYRVTCADTASHFSPRRAQTSV